MNDPPSPFPVLTLPLSNLATPNMANLITAVHLQIPRCRRRKGGERRPSSRKKIVLPRGLSPVHRHIKSETAPRASHQTRGCRVRSQHQKRHPQVS